MNNAFTRLHRITGTDYSYSAAFDVDGRGIEWKATVLGGAKPFALSGEIEMADDGPFDAREVVAKEVETRIYEQHR